MANTLREVLVKITANASGLDRELTTALGKTKRFGAEMSQIGQTLTLGLTLPLAGFGAAAVKAAADMDALARGLQATTKEAGPVTTQLERLREVAKLPGLDFKQAVQGSINLQAVGYSAAQSERIIKVFGNALASVGRGAADLDGVIVQFQQMSGKSKVLAEDIKPLIQRVPQLGRAMQELFGTIDTEQIQKMGITSKEFRDKVIGWFEKLPDSTGGIKNSFANLADTIEQAMSRVGKVLVDTLGLDKKIESLGNAVEKAGKQFAEMSPFGQAVAIALTGIATAGPLAVVALGSLIEKGAVVVKFFRDWELAAAALSISLNAIPYVAIAGGIYYLGSKLSEYGAKADSEKPKIDAINQRWREQHGIVKDLHPAMTGLLNAVRSMPSANQSAASSAQLTEEQLKKLAEQAYRVRDAWDASHERSEKFAEDYIRVATRVNEASAQLASAQLSLSNDYAKAHERMREESLKTEEIVVPLTQRIPQFVQEAERQIQRLNVALKESGADKIATADSVERARENFDLIAKSGKATAAQLLQAWVVYEEARQELARASGQVITAENAKALDDAKKRLDQISGSNKKILDESEKMWGKVQKQISRTFDHMASGMADAIVKWKGFGETLKSIAQEFASGILEIFIRRMLDPLQKRITDVVGGIFGGGSSSPLGGGTGIIKNAVGGGGSIASAGGSAGGAGSAAVSAGLNATLGTIFAGVGAAAGIGNILVGMKQEGTMNQVERNTAAASIHLQHILETGNQYWPELASIRGYLWDHLNPAIASLMSTVETLAQGGNQKIQLVVDGKVLAEAIARALPVRSSSFA